MASAEVGADHRLELVETRDPVQVERVSVGELLLAGNIFTASVQGFGPSASTIGRFFDQRFGDGDLRARRDAAQASFESSRVAFGGASPHLPADVCGSAQFGAVFEATGAASQTDLDVVRAAYTDMVDTLKPLAWEIANRAVTSTGADAETEIAEALDREIHRVDAAASVYDQRMVEYAIARLSELRNPREMELLRERVAESWLYSVAYYPIISTLQGEAARFANAAPSIQGPNFGAIANNSRGFSHELQSSWRAIEAAWTSYARQHLSAPVDDLRLFADGTFAAAREADEQCARLQGDPWAADPGFCEIALEDRHSRIVASARGVTTGRVESCGLDLESLGDAIRDGTTDVFCGEQGLGGAIFEELRALGTPGDGTFGQPFADLQGYGYTLLQFGGGTFFVNAVSNALGNIDGGILDTLVWMLLAGGVFLIVVVPMLPLLYGVFHIISWFIDVVQMIVLSPIWALAHFAPDDGSGGPAPNPARGGYSVLARIFVTPALLVIGMLLALGAITVLLPVLTRVYWLGVASIFGPGDVLGMVVAAIVHIILVIAVVTQALGLVAMGDVVGVWIGGQVHSSGSENRTTAMLVSVRGGVQQTAQSAAGGAGPAGRAVAGVAGRGRGGRNGGGGGVTGG